MIEHLDARELFSVSGKGVPPRMLPLVLRIFEPLEGWIHPRRRDPAVPDASFPGKIASDENREDVSKTAIPQLADFTPPRVVRPTPNRQDSAWTSSVDTSPIFKRLKRNAGFLEVAPLLRKRCKITN